MLMCSGRELGHARNPCETLESAWLPLSKLLGSPERSHRRGSLARRSLASVRVRVAGRLSTSPSPPESRYTFFSMLARKARLHVLLEQSLVLADHLL